jgi:(S)-ureidoglycine aminohydrolase
MAFSGGALNMQQLGQTRSARRSDHILQTPDTFVRAPLPGMQGATAVVHVNPAAGARFTQYTAEFEPGGQLGPTQAQRFLYVLEGTLLVQGRSLSLGDYVYLPAGNQSAILAPSMPGPPFDSPVQGVARAEVIEKPYLPLAGSAAPEVLFGAESQVASQPLMGDPWLEVRPLLPDQPAFDFAVNTMSYHPGAALSMVELHVMEHGLLMLAGGGIYRLADCWYAVTAGDFIWMAAYCPQWFGALGKTPAKYLIYKDWNRHPLE